ncbi:VOC family protein [Nonomuraea salmonea]|uniref:VOC family protein n=1 Tax=Nonomuraea salmonea TaxID=46181 RepID=UPI002FE987B5
MQKITTFLWFNDQAEQAATFYTSLFADSRIVEVRRGPGGGVMVVTFELAGQRFMALNGGPPSTP